MRYIVTEDKPISLPVIEQGIKAADANYAIAVDGQVSLGSDLYGVVDLSLPADSLFDDEIEELKEELEEVRGRKKQQVMEILNNAQAIVAVQVLWENRDTEATLEKLDPLWEWLFANYQGLLQADGEGYYERDKVILKI